MSPDNDLATELLLARLGAQDKMLDRILSEQKRTNGNVTELKAQMAAIEGEKLPERMTALERADAIEVGLIQHHQQEKTQKTQRRDFVIQVVCIVMGGAIASVGHVVGLW